MDLKVIITINEKNANLYNALFAKAYQALKTANKLKPEFENEEGRFLSLDDYFAHMSDLLALDVTYMMLPLDETTFAINANTRSISTPKIVTLQNDQIAETVVFTIDRFFDYMDLYNATIYVQWTLPSGKEGATLVEMKDIESIPGKIRFGWPLDSEITSEVGQVKYSVRFWNKGVINNEEKVVYSFNTLSSSLNVSASLQPEITPDLDINAPHRSSIFAKAIRNSQATSYPIPVNPTFGEPGLDLPLYASLVDNTLTLKAQAVIGDTGTISYRWYYKPAVDVVLGDDSFNHEVFYPFEDDADPELPGFEAFGGTVATVFEEVEYEAGEDLAADEFYYTLKAGSSPASYEAYTDVKAPTDDTALYQKFTTYAVPQGEDKIHNIAKDDMKVTGEYIVRAVNTIGVNTSNEEPSSVCRLVSPDNVAFSTDLDATYVMAAAGGNLKVAVNEQASDDAVVTYAWRKNIKSSERTEEQKDNWVTHENTSVANSNVLTPGWYDVTVSATLNREAKVVTSSVCKVTFDPVVPTLAHTVEDNHPMDGDMPIFSDDTVTLSVATGSVVPSGYEAYDEKLFSENLEYVWKITMADTPTRPLTQTDIDSGLVTGTLGGSSITINNPNNKLWIISCYVTNVLNGKVVTSTDEQALRFKLV